MSRNLREALNDVVGDSTWRPDNTLVIHDAEKWTTLVGYIVMATNGDNDGQVPMGCEDAVAEARAPLDHHPEEPETGPPGIRCSCGADWGPLGCEARAPLDEHRGLTVDEWAVHLRSCSGCAARWVEARAPLDVNVLRDAARRSGMPINVTVADIENLAREYDSGVRYWDGKDAALEEPTP